MPELEADFEISTNNLEAEYEITQSEHFDCSFEIFAAGTTFSSITGSPYDNGALSDALNQKADNSTVEELSETVTNNYNTLDGKIDTHIADKTNPHEVTKAQVGLDNVDNTSDLNKPISTATQTALNGKQNTINDLSEIRTNASNGQSAYNTIQTYGDIVTYDASNFATLTQGQKADTALQPNDNISELNNDAGYITNASLPTVNNSTITFQKNNVTVGDVNLNQPNNETINFNIPTTASDVNALPDTTTIEDLTTTAQQNAIDSGANTTNIGQIATNTSNISSLSNTVTNNYNTLDGRITSEVSALNTAIGTETTNRQNADNNLQSQIDAIVSSSDVFDIVGTYAELQAYDISTVPVNDIIKVLVDSTHNNAATYYRCVESGAVKSWLYLGSEGAYYTKSESDSLFVAQTTTVNGKALSTNITLTASDVGALPSSTTIGNGVLTIQNNSVDVDTFSANATSNKTINIITPTKTSDLTNDSGFIDNSALSNYATQTDLTNGLATKQDTISDLSTIRSNAANGQSAYTTIGGYGDIVTHNTSEFATSAQGDLADTSIQPNDNITLLNNNAGFITGIDSTDVITALGYTPYNSTNPAGYTSNVGTVTSVNNTQPDANGNVTISVTGGANTDLSNLTATGEAHFQKPLVSGTNIKTVNNTSILGSGNIDTSEIFVATYGTTTFNEIKTALTNGKIVLAKLDSLYYNLTFIDISVVFQFSRVWQDICYMVQVISTNSWSSENYIYQKKSTAVTHTANTAVGSSTTPVYIASNGKATSTGLSIASSRFDGQWVLFSNPISLSTATSATTTDVTSTIKTNMGTAGTDSYKYEILIQSYCNYKSATAGLSAITTNQSVFLTTVTSGATTGRFFGIIPVYSDKVLKFQRSAAMDACTIYFCGYRRIGTNS